MARLRSALETACAERPAAFIVEPLILGAGGMLIYPPHLLRAMADICARHDVLFIADEVMTGFGRTGTLFACEQADVVPDIACYAKGLTGGGSTGVIGRQIVACMRKSGFDWIDQAPLCREAPMATNGYCYQSASWFGRAITNAQLAFN